MKIFRSIEEIKDIQKTVLALGNFDGMHIGHQELMKRAVNSAKVAGFKSGVFTFTNHPKNAISKDNPVKKILSTENKFAMIEATGADYLFSVPFTEELMHMAPKDFVDTLLRDKMNMIEAYCGFNYHFGYKAKGDVEYLTKLGLKEGFGIHVLEPIKAGDIIISSTLIRSLIQRGDMVTCNKLLGRYYSLSGKVKEGNKIGRTIGFPTTNIYIDETMAVPAHGVYITYCYYNGVRHCGITNVGVKPTIGDKELLSIETHLLDFDKDIYHDDIKVEFIKMLRHEKKFNSVDELVAEIAVNVEMARDYHNVYSI